MTTAIGGVVRPGAALGNYVYDSLQKEWFPMVASAGVTSVNIAQWGGVAQTGANLTPIFQSLVDDTLEGIYRSIGDCGAGAVNVTGETVLAKLDRTADSADTVGIVPGLLRSIGDTGNAPVNVTGETMLAKLNRIALSADTAGATTGLIRSIGDAGLAPVNATGNTVLKLLTDILTALAGVAATQWQALGATGSYLTPAVGNVDLDTGVNGGRLVAHLHAINTTGGGGATGTITVRGSIDNVNWVDLFNVNLIGVNPSNNTWFNAFRYLRVSVTAVPAGTVTVTLATSR